MQITSYRLLKPFLTLRFLAVFTIFSMSACSGIDVNPEATDTFVATGYTTYAWRSAPPSSEVSSKDILPQKSPYIRAALEEKMTELGYQRIEKDDAEFLVEYLVASGHNDGQLVHGGSNDLLYGSSANREIDGASADNAYALSGIVETGDITLLFFDAMTNDVLWQVQMSIVVENANRIDDEEVRKAIHKGLSSLPQVL
ncbi:hypothetical protein NOR51B_130 [Luminiphilus syltensis NOR5-1B]|uniref:DUF4136 domain-containing protein n=1 Tax=Luminiphilus syltensis NOR5-1B TaxID=565045 RepID=B8KYF8_9GAMM|nr:DUF4136 domain-containing protein [Luminiphilus syltensis]EED34193.1 hypothetical protein NOR51B_130 [Luminiphilus syltensis NOR5-1B]